MFIHFSCIRTFKFLYSYILSCWCFFDCPSLHLSLSCVSLLFGTQMQIHLVLEPFSSKASTSSSDPIPSLARFCDDKARNDFSENFSRWVIHLECQVILSDFSDTDLPTFIYSRGWGSLCDIPVTCPFMIIQEFYFNMHGFDTSVPHFFSRVRGTHIVVTSDIVSEVLHVPRVAHPDYPDCDHLRTVYKDEL